MTSINRYLGLLWVAALTVAAITAANAETLKLTVVAGQPPIHTIVVNLKEAFIPAVDKALAEAGGTTKIEWTQAYGGSMAKFTEVLETVEEGIAHIGAVTFAFEESKLPLEQYTFMIPFGPSDNKAMASINRRVRAKVPEMDKAWDQYNQVLLGVGAESPWHIFTKFPLTNIEDLKGRKIGATGSSAQLLRGTGAVIVNSNMFEAYNNIKNSLYDGYPCSVGLCFVYKIYEAAPYLTQVNFGARVGVGITVNQKVWNSASEELKHALRAGVKAWIDRYEATEASREASFLKIMQSKGTRVSEFTLQQRTAWANAMPNVPKEWAADLDKAGKPGSKLLQVYMEELRATAQPIPRQWDKQ
jgi:TRAP-type C4-dicarboxylate transport system substrate-binding protein